MPLLLSTIRVRVFVTARFRGLKRNRRRLRKLEALERRAG
jgi:hypothetical protein